MKICVFSDVHGNLEQLKKLTETVDFIDADMRICLGDMVGLGPYQKECMDLITKYNVVHILGNHEARMLKQINDINPKLEKETYKHFAVFRKKLTEYLPLFQSMPKDYSLTINNKKIYFTHYGWYNFDMANKDIEQSKKPLLEQFNLKQGEYDIVVYGHIHSPKETTENGTKFICVGSLGLKSPGNYIVIEETDNNIVIERKTLQLDKKKFLKNCEELNYPCWEYLKDYSFSNIFERNEGTVLVTGGGGYIGTNIVQKLANLNYKVVVVDNFSNSHSEVLETLKKKRPNNIVIYNFDLLNTQKLKDVLITQNITSVIHLAGKKYVAESFEKENEYYKNNVTLTKNLLDLMQELNIKNIVFSSSITVYGKPNTQVVIENEQHKPLSPYAMQKSQCEKLVYEWQSKTGGSAVVLRLSNPIGANTTYNLGDNPKTTQYKGILPYIIENVKNNNQLKFNGGNHPTKDGTTIRDYVHVEDVARAFVNAMEKNDKTFSVYNIGSGMPGYSVLDILKEVEKCLNKTANYTFGPIREGDVSVFISNTNLAKKELEFEITKDLTDMVKSQVEFENTLNKNNK